MMAGVFRCNQLHMGDVPRAGWIGRDSFTKVQLVQLPEKSYPGDPPKGEDFFGFVHQLQQ